MWHLLLPLLWRTCVWLIISTAWFGGHVVLLYQDVYTNCSVKKYGTFIIIIFFLSKSAGQPWVGSPWHWRWWCIILVQRNHLPLCHLPFEKLWKRNVKTNNGYARKIVIVDREGENKLIRIGETSYFNEIIIISLQHFFFIHREFIYK